GGRITDDILVILGKLLQNLAHPLDRECILVTGLGGRQDKEILATLVLDQGLIERRLAVDHVDQVVDDPALTAHDEIQIAQPDVEVDDGGFMPTQRQPHGDSCTGGGFAHPALAGCYYDYSGQNFLLEIRKLLL